MAHANDAIEYFESSFRDKEMIPLELEMKWLSKAVAHYRVWNGDIEYDPETGEFGEDVDEYTLTLLAQLMRKYYQEREVSKVNHRVSIVTKDMSIDGAGHTKTAAREELNYHTKEANTLQHALYTSYADNDVTKTVVETPETDTEED